MARRCRPSETVSRTRWRALRQLALRRDGFACVECGARGRLEVHHVEPVRHRPDLAYVLDNLRTLCPSHHVEETRRELGQGPISPNRKAWLAAVRQLSRSVSMDGR